MSSCRYHHHLGHEEFSLGTQSDIRDGVTVVAERFSNFGMLSVVFVLLFHLVSVVDYICATRMIMS